MKLKAEKSDVLCGVGVAMLAAGLWLIHPAAMLCGIGGGLAVIGVCEYRNRQPKGTDQ